VRDKKTKRHITTLGPVTDIPGDPRCRVTCSCGYCSDAMPTVAEAWLDASIHRRAARRTNPRTVEPRWVAGRRDVH